MGDTRRQVILAALRIRLQAIHVADGYQTDAGDAVVIGEAPQLGPDDSDVAIALMVQDDDIQYQGENVNALLPIEIQAVAKVDLERPWWTAEMVLGDIKRAIEVDDRTLAGVVPRRIQRGRTRIKDREAGSSTVGIGVTYIAPYLEAWGRP